MYYIFAILSPIKGSDLSFEHIWISIAHVCFVPSLVEISLKLVLPEKTTKLWKDYDDDDNDNDKDDGQTTRIKIPPNEHLAQES